MHTQRGFLSLSTIGYGVLAIAAIAALFYFQQQRLNVAVAEKKTAETQLASANEKLVTTADANAHLTKTIETLGRLQDVANAESKEAVKERIVVQTEIKTITKTLPGKVITVMAGGLIDMPSAERGSLLRITAIHDAFCLASPTDSACTPSEVLSK